MHFVKSTIISSTLISTLTFTAQAEINVVASVKPVHSLVSGVMDGVGKPALIVKGSASPHTYSLKPSQAQQIEEADLVFWMGHELESFLEKPLEAIATKAKVVELIDSDELKKLDMREGGAFDDHGHDEHGHDEHGKDEHGKDEHGKDEHDDDHKDHDKHSDEKHDDHDEHDEHASKDHDEDGHKDHDEHSKDKHDEHADESHDEHHHGEFDVHVWLDPENAKVLVQEIKEALIEIDPGNAGKYEANTKNLIVKLDQLVSEISATLESSKGKGYIVFHDAYQYFEERFGMTALGSITVSAEVVPGASRIRELKDKIVELDAHCVFSEPQFQPKIVFTVAEGTKANTGVLDPLGASIADGPELYFTLIRDMANSLQECLSKRGDITKKTNS